MAEKADIREKVLQEFENVTQNGKPIQVYALPYANGNGDISLYEIGFQNGDTIMSGFSQLGLSELEWVLSGTVDMLQRKGFKINYHNDAD